MASKSIELHKSRVIIALKPRREPYWGAPISRGRYVGYRKIDAGRGSWVARMRTDGGKQKYHSIDWSTPDFGYDQAKVAAGEWFKLVESGADTSDVNTVADACRAYVANLAVTNGAKSSRDAELRLSRTVYGSDFGKKPLGAVRKPHVEAWRDALKLKPENFNRTLRSLKAALRMAVENSHCTPNLAAELKKVKASPGEKKRRALYLDLDERRVLLDHCGDGSLRDFVEAAMLTGARGGELADAKRSQFDERTGTMKFIGKTRLKVEPRTVPISKPAIALFKRLAKGKGPDDLLLMRDEAMTGFSYCEIDTRKFQGLIKIDKPMRWLSYDWGGMFKQAVAAAGLRNDCVMYTLRHCWITTALMGGMTTLDVARLSGTSLLMIEKHYGHLISEAARERLAGLVMT